MNTQPTAPLTDKEHPEPQPGELEAAHAETDDLKSVLEAKGDIIVKMRADLDLAHAANAELRELLKRCIQASGVLDTMMKYAGLKDGAAVARFLVADIEAALTNPSPGTALLERLTKAEAENAASLDHENVDQSVVDELMCLPAEQLVARLLGNYAIPVNDGAGPLNGSMEYQATFRSSPIKVAAANTIAALLERLERADRITEAWAAMTQNAVRFNREEEEIECSLCFQTAVADGSSSGPDETGSWHAAGCPLRDPPTAVKAYVERLERAEKERRTPGAIEACEKCGITWDGGWQGHCIDSLPGKFRKGCPVDPEYQARAARASKP